MYDYKKIQEMRERLVEEVKQIFPTVTVEVYKLVEMRLQTAIMAGLLNEDIKEEIGIKSDNRK